MVLVILLQVETRVVTLYHQSISKKWELEHHQIIPQLMVNQLQVLSMDSKVKESVRIKLLELTRAQITAHQPVL